MLRQNRFERRIQLAGLLMVLGLLIQGICFLAKGPVAFMIFLLGGGACLAAGILVYLFSLLIQTNPQD